MKIAPGRVGLFSGVLLGLGFGVLIGLVALVAKSPLYEIFFLTLEVLVAMAAVSLLFDFIQYRVPIEHPLGKSMAIWAVLFPGFRVLKDLLTLARAQVMPVPRDLVTETLSNYQDPSTITAFLILQGLFGSFFGIPFGFLYSKILSKTLKPPIVSTGKKLR